MPECELLDRVRNRHCTVCVVGLGYVGLPTSVLFAEKGFNVIGCDVKQDFVDKINRGESPLKDLDLGSRLEKTFRDGKLRASSDIGASVGESDVVLIAVPTPTKNGFEPDLVYVESAGEGILGGLHRGQLIVLESTVYPGVTEGVLKPMLERSGLTAGVDFGLAYCPERYNPGDGNHTIDRVTRVLGAVNEEWGLIAQEFYTQITKIHRTPNIRTAEMAKIIENTQRDLNIALMNEIAIICEKLGLDVMDVIQAAATKWNFNVYYPGSGVGGHCLPKDPWYLVKAAEKHGYHAQLITAGRRLNDSMPYHAFELLARGMNEAGKPLKGSVVVVLGLSYKENIGDTRNSPSLALIRAIRKMGGIVRSVDPFVDVLAATAEFEVDDHRLELGDVFAGADAVVLMTAHEEFRGIDLCRISESMTESPLFVDGRRAYRPDDVSNAGLTYLGIGYTGEKDGRPYVKPRSPDV